MLESWAAVWRVGGLGGFLLVVLVSGHGEAAPKHWVGDVSHLMIDWRVVG